MNQNKKKGCIISPFSILGYIPSFEHYLIKLIRITLLWPAPCKRTK